MKAEVEMTLPACGTLADAAGFMGEIGAEVTGLRYAEGSGPRRLCFELEGAGIDGPDVAADAVIAAFDAIGAGWETMTVRTAGATLFLQPSNRKGGEA
jgi:hypothetical protein